MTNLITHLREAKEGSRELDAEIHASLFPDDAVRLIESHPQSGPRYYVRDSSHLPAYTTDLSAAVALAERAVPNFLRWTAGGGGNEDFAYVEWKHYTGADDWERRTSPVVHGKPVALALCIAILTAKEKANA